MKMDISKYQQSNIEENAEEKREVQWYRLGVSKDKIKNTPKLFYNKYVFKVDITVPGAVLIKNVRRYPKFADFNNHVNLVLKKNNAGWSYKRYEGANSRQLYLLYSTIKEFKSDIRVRTENKHISICSNSEAVLYEFIKRTKTKNNVTDVFRPSSDAAEEKLNENTIFLNNPKFKFRAMIKSGHYDETACKQILNYFKNYKDSIIVSKSVLGYLSNEYGGYVQGYFHVDNTDVLLFLKMIQPRFVGKIFTLEEHETK